VCSPLEVANWRTRVNYRLDLIELIELASSPGMLANTANRSVRQFATPLEGGERRDLLESHTIESRNGAGRDHGVGWISW
jgi:hypothetical protein